MFATAHERKLKMTFWTQDEIDYLIAYGIDEEKESTKELATYLGRSESSVKMKLTRLRKEYSQVKFKTKPWTENEIKILKETYHYQTSKQLSGYLGRSEDAIKIKASKLGINKNIRVNTKDAEIRVLAAKGYTRQEIALELGLPYESIMKYVWLRRINCRKVPADIKNKYWKEQEDIRRAYVKGEIK